MIVSVVKLKTLAIHLSGPMNISRQKRNKARVSKRDAVMY